MTLKASNGIYGRAMVAGSVVDTALPPHNTAYLCHGTVVVYHQNGQESAEVAEIACSLVRGGRVSHFPQYQIPFFLLSFCGRTLDDQSFVDMNVR